LGEIETITVEKSDLDESREMLMGSPNNPTYCIGCPHCSLKEIEETANLVKGKDLDGKLWVFTSRGVYEQAKKAGLVNIIESAGGKVYRDTCMVVAPLNEMGWQGVGTNSMKGAHYSVAHGFPTIIEEVDKLIEDASR
jgi:predicted aconitase